MVVVWRVTENCNLGCRFCAYDRGIRRPRREADPEQILTFGEILAEYSKATGEEVLVSWLGGEPLLWAPLKGLSESCHGRFGLKVSTTTNGTMLSSKMVRAHLLEHYTELTVSVDGLGATHDALRGWPGGFAEVRRSIRTIASEKRGTDRGPRLRANMVLMRDNFHELEPLCHELASWGIEVLTFNQLGGRDRPEFYPDHRLLSHQAEGLAAELPGMRARLAARGLHIYGGRRYLRRIQATTHGMNLPVEDCSPGRRFLFIDERGLVAPCSFTVSECGVPVEQIDSVEALLRLGDCFSGKRRQKLPGACLDCHSTQVFDKFAGDG